VQAYDIARPGLVDYLAVLRHEGRGVRAAEGLARARVQVHLIALELARAYAQEGYAVAMIGVEVGVYLKDEAGEFLFLGQHLALRGLLGRGRGCEANQII
jgi:hypothetical protein